MRQELNHIKSLNADGVIVDCWWGIVEGWNPQRYVWSGYRELFHIIRESKLKLQVAVSLYLLSNKFGFLCPFEFSFYVSFCVSV